MKRKNILLLTLIVGLALLCLLLQFAPGMMVLSRNLQVGHVPSELLSYNKLGEIFHQLRLIRVIPNHSDRYRPEESPVPTAEPGPFQKRRQVGTTLVEPGREHHLMRAAREQAAVGMRNEGQLYISVVTEEENIRGRNGLLTNVEGRGRNWEKLAYVAIYQGDNLLAEGAAGLRLHGGQSRDPSLDRHSYRLYFRKIYGQDALPAERIFAGLDSLKTLVVHAEYDFPEKWPLNTLIANRLYRMAGVETLDYAPAHFLLNGVDYGLYWICPHLSERYVRQHYGLDKILYQRYRGEEDNQQYRRQVSGLAYDYDEKLRMERVGEVVDLDGLVNYLIAVTYSGNTDWNQGVAFRSAIDESSVWRWIAWDLDHSFVDHYRLYSNNPGRAVWEQEGLRKLLLDKGEKGMLPRRTLILQRLLNEDPRFVQAFVDRYVHVLNHELSRNRLDSLLAEHQEILSAHGSEINPLLADFFRHRHSFIRQELAQAFAISSFHELIVEGDYDDVVLIDNYPETLPYHGFYPADAEVTIGFPEPGAGSGYWSVDGEALDNKDLQLSLSRSTRVIFQPR